jgi:uncharacterized protein
METKLEIKEHDPSKISKPNIIVGVPEAGLVGTISASYLIQQLKLPEAGYVDSELVPPVVVHDSKPKRPIRIFGRNELVVIASEVPLNPRLSLEFAAEVARWAKARNSKILVGITSVPFESRMENVEEGKVNVLALASESRIEDMFKQIGASPFEEGVIVGTYAKLLQHCIDLGQPNLTLLAEAYPQFPDPGAAAAAIEVLNRVLPIQVDVGNLIKQADEVRLRMRQLMARTQENMKRMAETAPSVYGKANHHVGRRRIGSLRRDREGSRGDLRRSILRLSELALRLGEKIGQATIQSRHRRERTTGDD